jgi:hypothetical protein
MLFLLVIEALSRMINKAVETGTFKGLKVASGIYISHLLFVDDVLILGAGNIDFWKTLKILLTKFCLATGLSINTHKSGFIAQNLDPLLKSFLIDDYKIQVDCLDQGLKYLGFFLKPNCYRIGDWSWLIRKIEKKINNWTFRWLSLGGRLTLATSVLQSIPVFWLSLAKAPKSILHRIQLLISRFIWKGGKKTSGYHLANWQSLAKPKEAGGWGIKHLEWFALALAAKTCWRGLFGNNLWNKVITRKYLKGNDPTSWLRRDIHHTKTPSIIWQNLMLALPMIKRWLAWKVGTGQCVILGRDPYIGCEETSNYPTRSYNTYTVKAFTA